jgi:hypothetical protein
MDAEVFLEIAPLTHYVIRFTPSVIRDSVPGDTGGVYLLSIGPHPLYIGRSDAGLRQRLLRHNLRGTATHFVWSATRTPIRAYRLECAWYHSLRHAPYLRNAAHPGRPVGSGLSCPFCVPADAGALRAALGIVPSWN